MNDKTNDGETAFKRAITINKLEDRYEIIKILEETGAKKNQLKSE